jgi:hypothetical protein
MKMVERITSRLNKSVGDRSKSLKTIVPQVVVERLQLNPFDMLEWIELGKTREKVEKRGDFVVRKL